MRITRLLNYLVPLVRATGGGRGCSPGDGYGFPLGMVCECSLAPLVDSKTLNSNEKLNTAGLIRSSCPTSFLKHLQVPADIRALVACSVSVGYVMPNLADHLV